MCEMYNEYLIVKLSVILILRLECIVLKNMFTIIKNKEKLNQYLKSIETNVFNPIRNAD